MIARHPVRHLVRSLGATDVHGNATDEWASTPRMVFGWSQEQSDEPAAVGANRISTTLQVLSPWAAADKDRVVILGHMFEVIGESEDWNHGPFGFEPGYRFRVRRIDG
ncbi:hypothetical protein [Acidipropionibacterium timonense]|uniref:hypothetical protein n=1 Tax=Acidipropionibacterium timonense TaxID=2161818 RepID=UPI00102FCEB1|nr:hypothetical protein [Acidipropionibacterium timonense]